MYIYITEKFLLYSSSFFPDIFWNIYNLKQKSFSLIAEKRLIWGKGTHAPGIERFPIRHHSLSKQKQKGALVKRRRRRAFHNEVLAIFKNIAAPHHTDIIIEAGFKNQKLEPEIVTKNWWKIYRDFCTFISRIGLQWIREREGGQTLFNVRQTLLHSCAYWVVLTSDKRAFTRITCATTSLYMY